MLGGPLFSNTQESWWGGGGRGHLQRPLQWSKGDRSQFASVLPEHRITGGETHREMDPFPRTRKGREEERYPTPISQTITRVKDLVSESMRWVTGM